MFSSGKEFIVKYFSLGIYLIEVKRPNIKYCEVSIILKKFFLFGWKEGEGRQFVKKKKKKG